MSDYELVSAMVRYEPDTGKLTWRRDFGTQQLTGKLATGQGRDKRHVIRIFGSGIRASRLIWLLQTGKWPPKNMFVDHKNRDVSDDSWDNLRLVTRAQNQANTSDQVSTSGFRGAYPKSNGKYQSHLKVNGVKHYLGTFDTPEEAHEAYKAKHIEAWGEYSPYYND